MTDDTIAKIGSAQDAFPCLPPIGLGDRGSEFGRVFRHMFELIVLRGEKSRAVLNREAESMNRLMRETDAPCWEPDPSRAARAK